MNKFLKYLSNFEFNIFNSWRFLFEAQKYVIGLDFLGVFFSTICIRSYSYSVVLTLVNVVSILSNVVNINIEICKVNSTLFNFVNYNVDVCNVVSTLFDVATSKVKQRMRQKGKFQTFFWFLKEVQASDLHVNFKIFR